MVEKRTNKKKNLFIISVGLIIIIIAIIVNVVGKKNNNEQLDKKIVSSENHSLVYDDGLKIDVGQYAITEEKEIKVVKDKVVNNKEEESYLQAYDISIDDVKQLDDYIEIRIPYDEKVIDKTANEELCVCGMYFNETINDWENILYDVDTKNNEVVIYTNHLSKYCSYTVVNEGKRNARFEGNLYSVLRRIEDSDNFYAASNAMKSYIDNGGTDKNVFTKYAGLLLDYSDSAVSYGGSKLGVFSNFVNVIKSGNPVFSSDLVNLINSKINDLGEYASYATIASLTMKSITGDNKNDVLQLYKECINLLVAKGVESVGSSALAMSMSTVWIIDTVLSSVIETTIQYKHDNLYQAYSYYYNNKNASLTNYRSIVKWREILTDIINNNNGDVEKTKIALEKEIDDYCNIFWNLPIEEQNSLAGESGLAHMFNPDEESRKNITNEYKDELYKRLEPVIYNIKQKMLKDIVNQSLTYLSEVEKVQNKVYQIKISEEIPNGKKSQYSGYKVRFEELYENAPKTNWTGTLSNDGKINTKFTLIGYITAGSMQKLNLYKNEDDMNDGIVAKSIPFKITGDVTEIVIKQEEERPDFTGTYNGSYTDSDGKQVDFQVVVRIDETPSGSSNGENYYITATNLTNGKILAGLDGTYLTFINYTSGKANIADPYRFTFNPDGLSLKYEFYNIFKKQVTESGFAFKN